MKQQVVVIHGGDTFDSYEEYLSFLKDWKLDFEEYRSGTSNWKRTLGERLGPEFEVIQPNMPDKINAKYVEWKIWFEKFLPYLEPEVVLVGHSLGGTFLAKYLTENGFSKKVLATFLVAPAYDDEHADYSMADFVLPDDLSGLAERGGTLFLYGSGDDPVVPPADLEKFRKALPGATVRMFTDRGHFNQEELPELVDDIRTVFAR